MAQPWQKIDDKSIPHIARHLSFCEGFFVSQFRTHGVQESGTAGASFDDLRLERACFEPMSA